MGLAITFLGAAGAVQLLMIFVNGPRAVQLPKFQMPNRVRPLPVMIWPDVVDNIATAVRAGMSLPQAVCELSSTGPLAVQPLFIQVKQTYLSSGDFHAALNMIRTSQSSITAHKFVGALDIAYDVGGTDLGKVLRTLSEALRDDINTRLEIRARQSWTINGARIAVAAPWVTVLLLSTRSQAAQAYATPDGIRLLLGCALLSVAAYLAMMKLSRLPHESGAAI